MMKRIVFLILWLPFSSLADEARETQLKEAVASLFDELEKGTVTNEDLEKALAKSLVDYYRQMMVNKEALLKERNERAKDALDRQEMVTANLLLKAKEMERERVHHWEMKTFYVLRMAEMALDGMKGAVTMANGGLKNEFERTVREQIIFNAASHLAVYENGLREDRKSLGELNGEKIKAGALTRFEEVLKVGDEIEKLGLKIGWSEEVKKKHGAALVARAKWRRELEGLLGGKR